MLEYRLCFLRIGLDQQPHIYATSLADDKYFQNTRMYLAISAGTSPSDIIARTPQIVKVCSGDYIDLLVQKALPGVPLVLCAVGHSGFRGGRDGGRVSLCRVAVDRD